jgi:hypothetical protein
MISSPIIVEDNGDVEIFASVEDVERYLEPWVVEYRFGAYDCDGRLLEFRVERGEIPTFFGVSRIAVDYVVIDSAEDRPNHAPQLRAVLAGFFERAGIPFGDLDAVPVRELVGRGVEYVGFTV